MKKEKDKMIFVILLAAILVVTFVISSISNKPAETDEATGGIVLQNGSVYLEIIDMDTYYIGGEGILVSEDIAKLLDSNGVLTLDVVNLIIGDGITEISYNCINNYSYLESLKIGQGVKRIRNGAIKKCSSLKHLYIPSTVEKVGRDFLYGCDQLDVIETDGLSTNLNEIFDTNGYFILENINSYEVLLAAVDVNKIPYRSFDAQQLHSTDPDAGTDPILLHAGYSQRGPHAAIEKGEYTVVVSGANLDKISDGDIYIEVGSADTLPARELADITSDTIAYSCTSLSDVSDVQFCIANNFEGEIVEIDSLTIYYNNAEIPAALQYWWR